MTYICYKDFKTAKRGDRIQEQNGWLKNNGTKLCFWRSQNAKDHFFKDDDGNGLAKAETLAEIRAETAKLREASARLRESAILPEMTEEERENALESLIDPYADKLDELAKLPCFASVDAPYEATMEELQEAYRVVSQNEEE